MKNHIFVLSNLDLQAFTRNANIVLVIEETFYVLYTKAPE